MTILKTFKKFSELLRVNGFFRSYIYMERKKMSLLEVVKELVKALLEDVEKVRKNKLVK